MVLFTNTFPRPDLSDVWWGPFCLFSGYTKCKWRAGITLIMDGDSKVFVPLTFHKLGIVLKLTFAHTLIGRPEHLPSFACKTVHSAKKRVLIRKKREKSGHAGEQGGGGAIWATPQRIGFTWSPPVIYTVLVHVRPQPTWSFKSKWVGDTDFTQYEYSLSKCLLHIRNLTCNVDLHHLRLWSCSLPLLERAVVHPGVVQGGGRCDEAQVRVERKLKLLLSKKTAWCLVVIESRNSLRAVAN